VHIWYETLLRVLSNSCPWSALTLASFVPVNLEWKTPVYVLVPLATIPTVYYQLRSTSRPPLLMDVTALSFAHEAISLLQIDSWRTGTILLSGLFAYDIYWVSGTKVVCTTRSS